MIDIQQGDVLLFQGNDDGNILVEGGITRMSGGLETMAFICLFGGNEDDAGLDDKSKTWWGNLDEVNPAARLRSETQNLLLSLPATSGNLNDVQDAAGRDLAVFVTEGIATSVTVVASIPQLNRIKLAVSIDAEGETQNFEFIENWKASI